MKWFLLKESEKDEVWIPELGVNYLPLGERISTWNERNLVVYPREFLSLDFVDSIESEQIVSGAFRDIMVRHASEEDVQFLPIRYQKADGTDEKLGWSVMKVLRLVECLDTSGPGRWTDGRFFSYGEKRMREGISVSSQIFIVRESPSLIVVSEDICRDLEDANLTGFQLTYFGEQA